MIPEYHINLNKKEREGPAMQQVSMEAGAGNLGKPGPRFQAASAHRTQERPSAGAGDAGKEERNLGKPRLPPRVSAGQPPHDNIRRPLINSTAAGMEAVLVILCMEAAAFLVLAVRRIFTVGRREIDR